MMNGYTQHIYSFVSFLKQLQLLKIIILLCFSNRGVETVMRKNDTNAHSFVSRQFQVVFI
jgi:hypothetical protein